MGAPFGPTRRPVIGTRLPNFTFCVELRLFAIALSTPRSEAGLPFGAPRSPPAFAPVPTVVCDGEAVLPEAAEASPERSVEGPPVAGRAAMTTGVGAEQSVTAPPELAAVTQNCRV